MCCVRDPMRKSRLAPMASREDETSRREIGETVRAIVRRERIRRNNKVFQKLGREQGVALGEILPRRGPRSPRAPR